jgi:hypothetical protein
MQYSTNQRTKNMSEQLPTFGEWCDLHSFNPDNDDNFSLYLVWVQREKSNQ